MNVSTSIDVVDLITGQIFLYLNYMWVDIFGHISKISLPWSSWAGQTCPVEAQLQPEFCDQEL